MLNAGTEACSKIATWVRKVAAESEDGSSKNGDTLSVWNLSVEPLDGGETLTVESYAMLAHMLLSPYRTILTRMRPYALDDNPVSDLAENNLWCFQIHDGFLDFVVLYEWLWSLEVPWEIAARVKLNRCRWGIIGWNSIMMLGIDESYTIYQRHSALDPLSKAHRAEGK